MFFGQHFRASRRMDTAPTGPDTCRNRVRREAPTQGTGRMVGVEVLLKSHVKESKTSLLVTKLQEMLGRSRYRVRGRSWCRALQGGQRPR